MFKPELLSPAGTLKNMRYAYAYGADAVYAGQPRYSLRVRNNEFDHANLQLGINEAHDLGKKLYVVANIQPHNSKLKTFVRDMKPVIDMGPDALIMSDPGLIMMVREHFPEMPVHLSVQANAVNWATVKFWEKMGLERVILSRELSIEEIEEIRQQCPDIELEVFVHGALCMAYSGRCLLSGYINATRIRVPAPTPAAGNITYTKANRMMSARSCTNKNRSRSKLNQRWVLARQVMHSSCWKKRTVRVNS